MSGNNDADRLTRLHNGAGFDSGGDRFIGRAQAVAMLDRHDRLTADIAREDDPPGTSGSNGGAGDGAEIDAAVTGQPVLRWVVKPADYGAWCGNRPFPRGLGARRGGASEGCEDWAEEPDEDRHGSIAPCVPTRGKARLRGCG